MAADQPKPAEKQKCIECAKKIDAKLAQCPYCNAIQPYHVCLSYASGDDKFVKRVFQVLAKTWNVYYYPGAQDQGLGEELSKHLEDVFRRDSRLCAVFLSTEYVNKSWTMDEFEHVMVRAVQERQYLIPVRLEDDVKLPKVLKNPKYISGNVGAEVVARMIDKRIRRLPPPGVSYRRRLLVRTGVAAILAALVILVAWWIIVNGPSSTSWEMTAATQKGITIHAVNRGWKQSKLVGFRLKFGNQPPIEDTPLKVAGAPWAIVSLPPRKEADVLLDALQLITRCDPRLQTRPPYQDIVALIRDGSSTLEIDVVESGDRPEKPRVQRVSFSSERLSAFLKPRVPEYGYECSTP